MKDRKIQRLDLVFENCDVYRITPDMIVMFSVDHLYSSVIKETPLTFGEMEEEYGVC